MISRPRGLIHRPNPSSSAACIAARCGRSDSKVRSDAQASMNAMNRRAFISNTAVGAALAGLGPSRLLHGQSAAGEKRRTFRIWVASDPHVGRDIMYGRESLADAIRDSERPETNEAEAFNWDIGLMLGDFCGSHRLPEDSEGAEVVKQFGALRKHRREDIYELVGNHDASGPDEPTQWWFKKWIDPLGENTKYSGVDPSRRPYPIDGTWE